MLLGFISLLLTVGQKPIANICIPKSAGESFLPCKSYSLSEDIVEETKCAEQGKVSLMSRSGANELQYFIFVLAMFHVLSCILTSTLGMAKVIKQVLILTVFFFLSFLLEMGKLGPEFDHIAYVC